MPQGKLGILGLDFNFVPEMSITQVPIAAGAGATFSASNNIATITTNAAHGLTFNPSANVPPNYYIQPATSTSGLTGTGILVGNTFRILSIPSTTTFTIWTTVTAATVTSTTWIPVFIFPFTAQPGSGFAGGPTQTVSSVTTTYPYAQQGGGAANLTTGANCIVQYNPDNTFLLLDATTSPNALTPATAPTMRTLLAASSQGQIDFTSPQVIIAASGSAGTTRISVIE